MVFETHKGQLLYTKWNFLGSKSIPIVNSWHESFNLDYHLDTLYYDMFQWTYDFYIHSSINLNLRYSYNIFLNFISSLHTKNINCTHCLLA